MTRRKVWQYWCEYCSKHNLSASSITRHEKYCTANPNRACRMCAHTERQRQAPLSELIACIDASKPDEGLEDLRTAADGCPACMLAAIRQCAVHWPGFMLIREFNSYFLPEGYTPPWFDYKEECSRSWKKIDNMRCGYCGVINCGHQRRIVEGD